MVQSKSRLHPRAGLERAGLGRLRHLTAGGSGGVGAAACGQVPGVAMVSEGKRWAWVAGSQSTLSSGGQEPYWWSRGPCISIEAGQVRAGPAGRARAGEGRGGLRRAAVGGGAGFGRYPETRQPPLGASQAAGSGCRERPASATFPLTDRVPGLCGVGTVRSPRASGLAPELGRAQMVHFPALCSAVLGGPIAFSLLEISFRGAAVVPRPSVAAEPPSSCSACQRILGTCSREFP